MPSSTISRLTCPLIDPDERFTAICPRAPKDLPEGDGASWYDREGMNPDPVQFRAAVDAIESLIAHEAAEAGATTEQCVVGGFSQGGFPHPCTDRSGWSP